MLNSCSSALLNPFIPDDVTKFDSSRTEKAQLPDQLSYASRSIGSQTGGSY